jgi:hypothetical protein
MAVSRCLETVKECMVRRGDRTVRLCVGNDQKRTMIQPGLKSQPTSINVDRAISAITGFLSR